MHRKSTPQLHSDGIAGPAAIESLESRRLLSVTVADAYSGAFAFKEFRQSPERGTMAVQFNLTGPTVSGSASSPFFGSDSFSGDRDGRAFVAEIDTDGDGATDQLLGRFRRKGGVLGGKLIEADGDRGRFRLLAQTPAASSGDVLGESGSSAGSSAGSDTGIINDDTNEIPGEDGTDSGGDGTGTDGDGGGIDTGGDGTDTGGDGTDGNGDGDGTDDGSTGGDGGGTDNGSDHAIVGAYAGTFAPVAGVINGEKVGTGVDPIRGFEPGPADAGGTALFSSSGAASMTINSATDAGRFEGTLNVNGQQFGFVGHLGFPDAQSFRAVLDAGNASDTESGGFMRGIITANGQFMAEMISTGDAGFRAALTLQQSGELS